mmetsp:Transcript_7965/g.17119  ORF Transcript_7965/g.17119 Transcript_7965/m.17119 type:complete len:260 (-) Transcript_7965:390-1169(-)
MSVLLSTKGDASRISKAVDRHDGGTRLKFTIPKRLFCVSGSKSPLFIDRPKESITSNIPSRRFQSGVSLPKICLICCLQSDRRVGPVALELKFAKDLAAACRIPWSLLPRHRKRSGTKSSDTLVLESRTGCTLDSIKSNGNISDFTFPLLSISSRQIRRTEGMNVASGGYRRNNSVSVIALLEVLSLFEAFLSESTTRSIAAAKTIVEEFRIAHEGSSYPRIAEITASPTKGLIADARGASSMIILRMFNACTRHRASY